MNKPVEKINMRRAEIKDAEKLRDLRLKLVKAYPGVYGITLAGEKKRGLGYYQKLLANQVKRGQMVILAFDGKALIGMGKVRPTARKLVGYAGSMGVLPNYKDKGIGKLIHEALLEWAKKNSVYKKLEGNLVKTNDKLLGFYKGLGYKIVGEGEYQGVPEWDLEMEVDR